MSRTKGAKNWTKEEEAILFSMVKNGASQKKIAEAVGKSVGGVKGKITNLGLSIREKGAVDDKVPPEVITNFKLNKPVHEQEQPELELTRTDSLALSITSELEPLITDTKQTNVAVHNMLVKWRGDFISALGNSRGDFITIKEEIESIKKAMDKQDEIRASHEKMLAGALLIVTSLLSLGALWTILN